MSGVTELHADAGSYLVLCLVLVGDEQSDSAESVIHGVEGFVVGFAFSLSLSAAPFSLKLLDVSGVTEHNGAEVGGSSGSVYLSGESACIQQRQHTGVVDVGMGEQNEVDMTGRHRDLDVLEHVLALLHTEINEELFSAGFDICTASGDLVGSTDECHFHKGILL